jgi:hypothetical protein
LIGRRPQLLALGSREGPVASMDKILNQINRHNIEVLGWKKFS